MINEKIFKLKFDFGIVNFLVDFDFLINLFYPPLVRKLSREEQEQSSLPSSGDFSLSSSRLYQLL